jgi:outer membrane lipoprotein-sorting protein
LPGYHGSIRNRRCNMGRKPYAVVGLLLVFALLLSACGGSITAEEVVSKMEETIENTKDAHAVLQAKVDAQGITLAVTAEVWEKAPNLVRAEILDASEPRFAGMVMVSDGEKAWLYEPARNTVTMGSAGEMDMPLPQEMISSLQDVIQEVLDVSDVELSGQETVAGREAYKLTLSPQENAEQEVFPGNGTATLWVDKEQWIVLKAAYEANAFGLGNMEVQTFELNPGLPDSLFDFEVPEGATVIDAEAQKPEPMTLDQARAQAGFPLLVPAYVPDDATLIEVFQVGDLFVLRYNHSTEVSFTVVQGPELAGPPPLGQSQGTTVRGQDATVISDQAGGNTFLYWTENGVTVTVAGHLSMEEALLVAESLD